MTSTTRREARLQHQSEVTVTPTARKWFRWLLVALLIVVLVCAAWLAFRVLSVKNSLESAQASLQEALAGGDIAAAVEDVAGEASSAASAAGDPLWAVTEAVPFVGENLRAVRLASESLDIVTNVVGMPILAMQGGGEGSILARALPTLEKGGRLLAPINAQLAEAARSESLIAPVDAGIAQVADVVGLLQPILEMTPDLLGADGARNYLLVFQNNAEALPLGGSAASQTMIRADAGDLEITGQSSSAVFDRDESSIGVDIPAETQALHGPNYGKRVNLSTSRPDWPSAAQMAIAFWNRTMDDTKVDGAISVDPIALSRVLLATGPITVPGPDGDFELTHENAVDVLLSKTYEWWDAYTPRGAVASDAFFATVASSVFSSISSGAFDLKDMAWALSESIEQGSVNAWMADPEAQKLVESAGKVAGILPTENSVTTTVGIYPRDVSASKIDYYLDAAVSARMTCDQDEATVTASATLSLAISQEEADALPDYVKSRDNGSKFFSKHIFIYAPPGMELKDVKMDGRWVETFREGNTDLGRVVAPFQARMKPGESVTVEATFVGEGEFGPLDIRTTPTIRGTEVAIEDECQ